MPNTEISHAHWGQIVETIYKEKCVPFLGAGVNLGGTKEENLPSGGELALKILHRLTGVMTANLTDLQKAIRRQSLEEYRERTTGALNELRATILQGAGEELDQDRFMNILKKILPDEGELRLADLILDSTLRKYEDLTRIALQDLARVSLRYSWETGEQFFMEQLRALIPDDERKPSSLLTTLTRIPFRLLVTTNYDRLMERAMELLGLDDITDAVGLITSLRDDRNPVAEFLREQFSKELKGEMEAFDPTQQVPDELLRQLVKELNHVLQKTNLGRLGEVAGAAADGSPLVSFKPEHASQSVGQESEFHIDYLDVRENRTLLEAVYPQHLKPHKRFDVIVQPIRGFQDEEAGKIQKTLTDSEGEKGTVLFKLHGTFTQGRHDPKRRPVITEEDYIEFLTYIGGEGKGVDPLITAKMKDSTLLFLGYGLEDWSFRALFKGLIENMESSSQRRSFAIQKDPSEFWVSYWGRKNVIIYNVDLNDFAGELERRYKAYASQQGDAKRSGGEAGPRPTVRGPVKGGRR